MPVILIKSFNHLEMSSLGGGIVVMALLGKTHLQHQKCYKMSQKQIKKSKMQHTTITHDTFFSFFFLAQGRCR